MDNWLSPKTISNFNEKDSIEDIIKKTISENNPYNARDSYKSRIDFDMADYLEVQCQDINKINKAARESILLIKEFVVWPHERLPKKNKEGYAQYLWPVDLSLSELSIEHKGAVPRHHKERCQGTNSDQTQCYRRQTDKTLFCGRHEGFRERARFNLMSFYAKQVNKTMSDLLFQVAEAESSRKIINNEIDLARAAILPLVKTHADLYYDEETIKKLGKNIDSLRYRVDDLLYQRVEDISNLCLKSAKIDALDAANTAGSMATFLAGLSKIIDQEFKGEPDRAKTILERIQAITVATEKQAGISITIE